MTLFDAVNRLLDAALVPAHRTRHPVRIAQLVQHGAPYPLHRKGIELHPHAGVEARHRIHQTNQPRLHQIIQLDTGRQTRRHLYRHPPHHLAIAFDDGIAIERSPRGIHRLFLRIQCATPPAESRPSSAGMPAPDQEVH